MRALRDIGRFGAWLATITRNRANDYYRKAIPEEQVTQPVEDDPAETRSTDHIVEQQAAAILAVMRTLSRRLRRMDERYEARIESDP